MKHEAGWRIMADHVSRHPVQENVSRDLRVEEHIRGVIIATLPDAITVDSVRDHTGNVRFIALSWILSKKHSSDYGASWRHTPEFSQDYIPRA